MGKYLKEFQNHTQYETAQPNLILPNVSTCIQEGDVHYNPSSHVPPTPGHEYVDLGLPSGTKWATMNVGASSETDYGNYYQYGKGADTYQVTSGQSDYVGFEDPLALSADTAAQVWGGSWHMPTQTQFNELTSNTTSEWTTINSVNGYKFTATNGNYVFFPAAGGWLKGRQDGVGSVGIYWSSTTYGDKKAYLLDIRSEGVRVSYNFRDVGYSVRGVIDE